MGKNLYDYPFEYRIRMKYMMFGIMLGVSGLASLVVIPELVVRLLSWIFPQYIKFVGASVIALVSPFMMFGPLAYYMWYSKAKPKKYQHLNETVGLKADYDKVKGV